MHVIISLMFVRQIEEITLMVIIKVPKVNGARIKQIQTVRKTVAAIIILSCNTIVAAPRLMPIYTTPEV